MIKESVSLKRKRASVLTEGTVAEFLGGPCGDPVSTGVPISRVFNTISWEIGNWKSQGKLGPVALLPSF